jgi:tetratricopeptide (TPR) repeat protein
MRGSRISIIGATLVPVILCILPRYAGAQEPSQTRGDSLLFPERSSNPLSPADPSGATRSPENFDQQMQETASARNARLQMLRMDLANLLAGRNYPAAEEVYSQMLALDNENYEALMGRGYVRAWQGKYASARSDFQTVLQQDSTDLSALNGLGYTYAWGGEYGKAEETFRRMLQIEPGQIDATKGLAYTALWRGDGETAERRFNALERRFPSDPEIDVALGQARLLAGRGRDARKAFEEALRIDPGRRDAVNGLETARSGKPILELTGWGGVTWFSSVTPIDNNPQLGIRFLEIGMNAVQNMRIWFQYDNGLAMDNLVLAREDRNFPAYYVGGYYNYGRLYTTRLEAGWRDLPGQIQQRLFRGEQVVMLPKGYIAKAGGFVGPRDDERTEWIAYGALGIPARENFKIEPTFFYSMSGIRFEHQWRMLVSGEYFFPSGVIAGGGLAAGREIVSDGSSWIFDSFFRVSVPLNGLNHLHALVRHESTGPVESITILSIGYSLGISGL